MRFHNRAELVEITIDSASHIQSCAAAVTIGGFVKFQDSQIRHSGAAGLVSDSYSSIELDGGSIEGSRGIGLVKYGARVSSQGWGGTIAAGRPLRITGGASYPARVPLQYAHLLVPTRAAQDGWRGNAKDTVVAVHESAGGPDKLTIYAGLAWTTLLGLDPFYQTIYIREVELDAGATWTIGGRVVVTRLISRGTAEAPARIAAATGPWALLRLAGAPTEPSRFTHTRLARIWLQGESDHPVLLDDVVFDSGYVQLSAAGSRITRAQFRASAASHPMSAAVSVLAIAAADVVLSACEVTRSNGVGVRVEVAAGVRINDCNLHGNTGVAIDNRAAEAVDARHNWWGDPAGPNGPNGDRVQGNVLFEPYRTEPVRMSDVEAAAAARTHSRIPRRPAP